MSSRALCPDRALGRRLTVVAGTEAVADMPEISRFLGIVVGMFFNEHGPPHFHAVYGEHKITVEIESGRVRGEFPARALRLVLEWAGLHKQEIGGKLGASAAAGVPRED